MKDRILYGFFAFCVILLLFCIVIVIWVVVFNVTHTCVASGPEHTIYVLVHNVPVPEQTRDCLRWVKN